MRNKHKDNRIGDGIHRVRELGTELEVETSQERTISTVVDKQFCRPEKVEYQLSTTESKR